MVDPNDSGFWDYGLPMRDASRKFLAHKAVVAAKPSTGIYWWIPQPDGQWSVLAFHDEFYPMNDHQHMWRHVVDHLKTLYPQLDERGDIGMAYTGLPRGRVSENRRGQFVIYHGNDAPGSMMAVRQQFSLPADTLMVFDDHEQMLDSDHEAIIRALGDHHVTPE